METIIKRIKLLMNKNGVNENILAKDLDIPLNHIEKILQGKVEPKANLLIKLSIYFSCTIDYLVGFSDNENKHRVI